MDDRTCELVRWAASSLIDYITRYDPQDWTGVRDAYELEAIAKGYMRNNAATKENSECEKQPVMLTVSVLTNS